MRCDAMRCDVMCCDDGDGDDDDDDEKNIRTRPNNETLYTHIFGS